MNEVLKGIRAWIVAFGQSLKQSRNKRGIFIVAVVALVMIVVSQCAKAAALSDYLENKLVDHVWRGTAYTAPANTYVALYTSACSDAAGGTEVSTTSTGYARVAVSSATTSWNGTHGTTTGASSGTSGTISNAASITFGAPTANWGSITNWGILDASTGGNLLICAALTTPKTVNNGDAAPSFAASAMTIQVDN